MSDAVGFCDVTVWGYKLGRSEIWLDHASRPVRCVAPDCDVVV